MFMKLCDAGTSIDYQRRITLLEACKKARVNGHYPGYNQNGLLRGCNDNGVAYGQ